MPLFTSNAGCVFISLFVHSVGVEEEAVSCATQHHTGTTADTWQWVYKNVLFDESCFQMLSATNSAVAIICLSCLLFLDDEKMDNDENNQESPAENGEWTCRDCKLTDFDFFFCIF